MLRARLVGERSGRRKWERVARLKGLGASLRLWYRGRCAFPFGHANHQRRCIPRVGSHGAGDLVKRSSMAISRVPSRPLSSRCRDPGCRRITTVSAAQCATRSTSPIRSVHQREHRRGTRAPHHRRSCALHEYGTRFPSRKPVLVPRRPHCASRRSLRPARRTTKRTSPPVAGIPTLASRPQRTPTPNLTLPLQSPTTVSHSSPTTVSHSSPTRVSHESRTQHSYSHSTLISLRYPPALSPPTTPALQSPPQSNTPA